jgi:hypothetical protein
MISIYLHHLLLYLIYQKIHHHLVQWIPPSVSQPKLIVSHNNLIGPTSDAVAATAAPVDDKDSKDKKKGKKKSGGKL